MAQASAPPPNLNIWSKKNLWKCLPLKPCQWARLGVLKGKLKLFHRIHSAFSFVYINWGHHVPLEKKIIISDFWQKLSWGCAYLHQNIFETFDCCLQPDTDLKDPFMCTDWIRHLVFPRELSPIIEFMI